MLKFLKQLFASSQNPEQVSLTIKGVLMAIIPVAGMVVTLTGHQIDTSLLQQIVTALGTVITAFGALASTIMVVWGLIRKLFPVPPVTVVPNPTTTPMN